VYDRFLEIRMRVMMLSCLVLAAALALGGPAQAAEPQTAKTQTAKANASKPKPKMKVRVTRKTTHKTAWRGYGFLPGYTQPPNIHDPYARRRGDPDAGTYPWYGWPGYYRGRWNGGGFGPCYTKTPIGPVWNCG
jgi:hypothetical protein